MNPNIYPHDPLLWRPIPSATACARIHGAAIDVMAKS